MKSNPEREIVIYNIPTLVRMQLHQEIILQGSSRLEYGHSTKTFSAEDYLPSAVTDRPLPLAAVGNSVCDSPCEEENEVQRKQEEV